VGYWFLLLEAKAKQSKQNFFFCSYFSVKGSVGNRDSPNALLGADDDMWSAVSFSTRIRRARE
jgi:hypothetical protein